MPRKIDALLSEYGESHQNPTNKAIHWICVPAIVWSIVAVLWSLPVPAPISQLSGVNWMTVVVLLVLVYYMILSPTLAIGFLALSFVCVALIMAYEALFSFPIWQFALILFVVAWIGQFVGHKIEGKKPSFFKDVQFLLIGPAWLMHFLYKKMRIPY